jgi:AcrR family transcriptional regulator
MASERMAAKRAALRGRIIDAALAAFAARGFEATTMVDVAQRLQMTGPALYHYFRTKDELLFACIEQLLDGLHAELSAAAAGDDPPRERMARVVRAQVTMELKNGSSAPLVNAHLYGPQYLTDMLQPAQRESLRQRQRALVQIYRDLIDAGVKAGDFHVDSSAVAAFNVLAVVQYSGVWYRPRKGRRMADLIDAQVAAALQLLGAGPAAVSASLQPTRKARP